MKIASVAALVLAWGGLCLACGSAETESPAVSAPARVDQEEAGTSEPEFAIRELSPRKAEARDAVAARLSRAERRLEKLRERGEPLSPEEVAELETKTARARELLERMENVRGSDWDSLLVDVERTVDEIERGVDV